ncbi:MAG: hypothetical protein ABI688_04435 [Bacteroidota bacterium]
MKKIMLGLLVVAALSACTNYGKKIKVEGTKGEVYYKGDGVTEADAKKLGSYLKEQEYFDDSSRKTVQLMKGKDGGYDVRFVTDQDKIKTTPGIEDRFVLFGAMMSKNVFDNQPVSIYLADTHMKDYKSLAYDKKKAEELLGTGEKTTDTPPATNDGETTITKADFDHDKAGGVDFYWKGISDEESKTIADYIVQNGSFSGGTAELYMTKDGNHYKIAFPVIASSREDATVIAKLGEVSKQIKDNVFPNNPFSFYMTDEQMNTVKAWDY